MIISTLTGNPALWAKAVLFATYDENGGFFDHVAPVTAPPGTPDEYFDHTSVLRFLETRFGAEVPNLSAWRRATVGDLTSALNFREPDRSIPVLPSTLPAIPQILAECAISLAGTVPYQVPNPQSAPTQETGTAARPSGPC